MTCLGEFWKATNIKEECNYIGPIYSNCFKVVEHCKVCQKYASFMIVFW